MLVVVAGVALLVLKLVHLLAQVVALLLAKVARDVVAEPVKVLVLGAVPLVAGALVKEDVLMLVLVDVLVDAAVAQEDALALVNTVVNGALHKNLT